MRYRFKTEEAEEYPSDVDHIHECLMTNDIEADRADIVKAWRAYSESMCAGWLIVPQHQDKVRDCIMPYLKEVE